VEYEGGDPALLKQFSISWLLAVGKRWGWEKCFSGRSGYREAKASEKSGPLEGGL
jgi:hypothetical protein